MNFYPWRRIFPVQGEAKTLLRRLRAERVFPLASVKCVCTSRHVRFMILGIGQMHPVHQGKFGFFKAMRIALTQSWIFKSCKKLHEVEHVDIFGQEGFASAPGGSRARVVDELLQEVKADVDRSGPDEFLSRTASRWRKALKHGRQAEVIAEAGRLNGLVVLQALQPEVAIFPIEDAKIHGAVGENIRRITAEMETIRATDEFRSVQAKEGRKLNKAEYEIAVRYSELAKAFNKALASPERDRAMFQAIIEQSERERKELLPRRPSTVILAAFVLGQAHRHGFLRLARQHIPEDTLFVWVTPAPLLFWIRVKQGAQLLIVAAVLGLIAWNFWM